MSDSPNKILFVEDDPSLLMTFSMGLEEWEALERPRSWDLSAQAGSS
jgi:hypothetical protein